MLHAGEKPNCTFQNELYLCGKLYEPRLKCMEDVNLNICQIQKILGGEIKCLYVISVDR